MPGFFAITSTFFIDLITKFGVRPPPGEGFVMPNTVQPVVIVDSLSSVPIVTTQPPLTAYQSSGVLAAPAAAAVMADTGGLPAGLYGFNIFLATNDAAVANVVNLHHRNPADTADVWVQQLNLQTSTQSLPISFVDRMASGERLKIDVGSAVTAAKTVQATIFYSQVAA